MLTDAQKTTLAAAIRAETNAGVVAALAIRDDNTITAWCNGLSTTDAWQNSLTGTDLFQASDITKFDGLTSGKRDAWRMMLDFAPIDCSKNANRKAILDVWGTTDSVAVLQSCTRKATRGEIYLGGTSATTNTVAALKLNFSGTLSADEVSRSLNGD